MLTQAAKSLITNHSAGMVATIKEDGSPSVSPKATFVVLDDTTLAFGNIRSPGTLANLRRDSRVEVCFIDVVSRKAVRVTGTAEIVLQSDASAELLQAFERDWSPYLEHMPELVQINVSKASMITSPAYDLGLTEAELQKTNLDKLVGLYG